MNVLVTCAGRRTQMVQFLREALDGCGAVIAADASDDAPALAVADRAVTTPEVTHPSYVATLLDVCAQHSVGLVIPCLEPELPLLAAAREHFRDVAGTVVLVSSPEVVELCYDKVASNHWLERAGLPIPLTCTTLPSAVRALRGALRPPVVVKPRWGTTSFGVETVHDVEELELVYRLLEKRLARLPPAGPERRDPGREILTQEWLVGTEYGLDVLNDLDGNYVCTVVKRKLRMRAGQTDRAVAVRDRQLERIGAVLGGRLRHVGVLDCDVIVTESGAYVIDLNPRFGGGYPFSHVAGANLLAVILRWLTGDRGSLPRTRLMDGVTMAKRDEIVIVNTCTTQAWSPEMAS